MADFLYLRDNEKRPAAVSHHYVRALTSQPNAAATMPNSKDVISTDEGKPTDLFGNKVDVPYRVCQECGIPKHPSRFTGYHGICKPCRRERGKIEYQTNVRYRARILLSAARGRADRFGFECTLEPEWLEERLEEGVCEATGLPFEFGTEEAYKNHPRSPSLDKIDPRGGYTPSNTRVVCWQYNAAKAEGDDADVLKMAFALVTKVLTEREAA